MTNELGNQCTKWMIDKFQLNSFGSRTSKILIAFFNNISPVYVLCILIDLFGTRICFVLVTLKTTKGMNLVCKKG